MKRVFIAALLAAAALFSVADAQEPWKRTGQPFTCTVDNIGATLTEMTGCGVLTVGVSPAPRYHISTVIAQSTTSTGGLFTISSGTGTNCGTGTTAVMASNTARFAAVANTIAPVEMNFEPPLRATQGHALCLLGVATNT